jgi:hypothetical protein
MHPEHAVENAGQAKIRAADGRARFNKGYEVPAAVPRKKQFLEACSEAPGSSGC